MHDVIASLRGGLIVSCQPKPDSPFRGPQAMSLFAKSAELGGACAIRADGAADVRAIHRMTALPIIGINKIRRGNWPVYITPTVFSARPLLRSGAALIAADATDRRRPGGMSAPDFIGLLKRELGVPIMADVATLDEGLAAAEAGADLVATTLSGYTDARPQTVGPDLDILRLLAQRCPVPVICEGRVSTPQDVRAAFDAGAYAVVVGTAITNPTAVVRMFVAGAPGAPH
jgi:putative N-acetylmannosamine-6-phosphate epimerase